LPPRFSLFPYTTLFRSARVQQAIGIGILEHLAVDGDVLEFAEVDIDDIAAAGGADGRGIGGRLRPAVLSGRNGGANFPHAVGARDRKSTRLNSSHQIIS